MSFDRSAVAGYIWITIAALLFGVAGALAKVLFQQSFTALDLTILRAWMAMAVLLVIALTGRIPLRIRRSDIGFLFVLGVLLSAVNYTFYLAIQGTSVAIAIMLEYTAPIFVTIFALIAGTSRLDRRTVMVIFFGTTGCFFLVGAYDDEFLTANGEGILAGLACGVAFALYNLWGNRGHDLRLNSWTMTFYSFAVSAAFWTLFVPVMQVEFSQMTVEATAYLVFIGIFATVLPYWMLMVGLKTVPAFQATVVGMLDPLAATVFASILVAEFLALPQWGGMALIIVAILYLKKSEREPRSDQETDSADTAESPSSGTQRSNA